MNLERTENKKVQIKKNAPQIVAHLFCIFNTLFAERAYSCPD
jgi:hypothetical protein